jgi:hypothetical protein
MSQSFVSALVAFAAASASAHAFPHTPTPEAIRQRVALAAKDVADAVGETGAMVEGGHEFDLDALVAGLIGNEEFLRVLTAKALEAVNKDDGREKALERLSKSIDETIEGALKKAMKKVDDHFAKIADEAGKVEDRLVKLEEFAGEVDEDLGPRLVKLEAAIAADGEA